MNTPDINQDQEMAYYVEITYIDQNTGESTTETTCVADLQQAFDLIAEHYGNAVPPHTATIKTL